MAGNGERGRICFLTMDSLVDSKYPKDDDFASDELKARGYKVDSISWKKDGVNWKNYDLVVVRSTWDYQYNPTGFVEKLREISRVTVLENSPELIRYNSTKLYLDDFENPVPTTWFTLPPTLEVIKGLFEVYNTNKLVVKPQIGAGSECTHVIKKDSLTKSKWQAIVAEYYERQEHGRRMMAQPFRSRIQTEGEYSAIFFGEKLSHIIIKKPKEGDFRVQGTFGANIVELTDPALRALFTPVATAVHSKIPKDPKTGRFPLYARVDMVRNDEGHFELMELELIEPMLYFQCEPKLSPKYFADAVEHYLRKK